MNGEQKIRSKLAELNNEGYANACRIFKAYAVETDRNGWHFQPFGEKPHYLGNSVKEALETLETE